jgi:ABC-2 type transport system permease protein
MSSAIVTELRASYGFIERNLNIVKRYWAWELVWLCYSVTNSLAVTYIGPGVGALSNVTLDSHFLVLYLVIGTVVWRYLSVIFYWLTDIIGLERWEGTIEYTLMAPIARLTHLAGHTVFAVAYSLFHTFVILGITALFFDINLSRANLAGVTLILLVGSISFIGVGIVAAILPLLFPEKGSQMTHVIISILLLVSGVYYPVSVLPEWLRFFAQYSPATYVLEGARAALLDGAPVSALWPFVWPLLVMGVIAVPVGLYLFRLAERYAKRAGKLKRNG